VASSATLHFASAEESLDAEFLSEIMADEEDSDEEAPDIADEEAAVYVPKMYLR
jgi:hypothetical protein